MDGNTRAAVRLLALPGEREEDTIRRIVMRALDSAMLGASAALILVRRPDSVREMRELAPLVCAAMGHEEQTEEAAEAQAGADRFLRSLLPHAHRLDEPTGYGPRCTRCGRSKHLDTATMTWVW